MKYSFLYVLLTAVLITCNPLLSFAKGSDNSDKKKGKPLQILGAEPNLDDGTMIISGKNFGGNEFKGVVKLFVTTQGICELTALAFDPDPDVEKDQPIQELLVQIPADLLTEFPGSYLLLVSNRRNNHGGGHDDDDNDNGEDCNECDGKVIELTLRYDGDDEADIVVLQKKGEVAFEGVVQPGDEFTALGQDSKGTLGTQISIFVDGDLNTKIHTSCSKPIGPGLVKGDFEVVAGFSRNGGALCPIGSNGNNDDDNDDDGDDNKGGSKKKAKFDLFYVAFGSTGGGSGEPGATRPHRSLWTHWSHGTLG